MMWLQEEEEGGGLLKEGGSHQHSGIPAHSIFFVLSSTPFLKKKINISVFNLFPADQTRL
jgi:hypothetical protein